MQVSDSQAAACAGVAAKDEVGSPTEQTPDRARSRSGRGFRGALERRARDSTVDTADLASAAALAGWFRSEMMATASPAAQPTRTPAVVAARAVDRILIGSGPDGAQARIRIGAGALAGTEIQLSSTAGRTVEAHLLTHAATSRQTLAVALEEIRSRLRDRGIVLATKAPAQPTARTCGTQIGSEDGPRGDAVNEPSRGTR